MAHDSAYEKKRTKSDGKQGEVAVSYDAVFRGYVNLDLSADDKEAFVAWFASGAFWERLNMATADGVNFAVKIDPKSGGFLASATQRRVGSPNAGLVATARGKSADIAMGRVVFIVALLSIEESWEVTAPIADPDRW